MALFRNAFGVLATSAARIPLQFANSVVLARLLAVEDRGVYGVVGTFVALGTLLFELGWGPALIYRIRRLEIPAQRVAGSALWFIAVVSILLSLLGLFFGDWVRERLLNGSSEWVLLLALLAIPLRLFWLLYASMARGLDRFALQNSAQLAVAISRLPLMVLVLVVLQGALLEAVAVYVLTEAIGAVMVFVGVLRSTGIGLAPGVRELVETQRFAIQAYASRVGNTLHERVDIFMLAYFLSATEVAHYAIAVMAIGILKMIPEAIARALYPQLAGTAEDRASALTARMSRHSMLWVGLSVVGGALAAPVAIPLIYGQPYVDSVVPFLILLPAMALYSRYRIFSNYFASVDRQGVNIATQLVTAMLNIALNLWAIPRFGIIGAATASFVSYAVASVWISTAFSRNTGFGLSRNAFVRAGDWEPYGRRLRPVLRRLRLAR